MLDTSLPPCSWLGVICHFFSKEQKQKHFCLLWKINICEFKGEISESPSELLLFRPVTYTCYTSVSLCLHIETYILNQVNAFIIDLNSFSIHMIFESRCHCLPFSMNVLSKLSMCSPLNVLYVFFRVSYFTFLPHD